MTNLTIPNLKEPLRWESYSPFNVGLEDFFKKLDTIQDSNIHYPPYNVIATGDKSHRIEVALAGWTKEELEVSLEKNVLSVVGKKTETLEEGLRYAHRGIAFREFKREWKLSDDVVIDEITLVNGLLTITIPQELAEHLQKRLLPIT